MIRIWLNDWPQDYNDIKKHRKDNPGKINKRGIGSSTRYGKLAYSAANEMRPLIAQLSWRDAYLFSWATGPLLRENIQLIEDLGFRFKTIALVWVKTNNDGSYRQNPGFYTWSNVELLLLGVKGRPWHSVETGCWKPNQIVAHPLMRDERGIPIHSRKPPIFHELINRWLDPYIGAGQCAELFATQHTPGWRCLGNTLSGLDIRRELQCYADAYQTVYQGIPGLLTPYGVRSDQQLLLRAGGEPLLPRSS